MKNNNKILDIEGESATVNLDSSESINLEIIFNPLEWRSLNHNSPDHTNTLIILYLFSSKYPSINNDRSPRNFDQRNKLRSLSPVNLT